MVCAADIKYVRDKTGLPIQVAKSMAMLLEHDGMDPTSEDAERHMCLYGYTQKAYRYTKWLEIKDLIHEFGSFD